MFSLLAQATSSQSTSTGVWLTFAGVVVVAISSTVAALIANRARITGNKVEHEVTPNNGSSAHDLLMKEIGSLRTDVQRAVERDDGRFVRVERDIASIRDRYDRDHPTSPGAA